MSAKLILADLAARATFVAVCKSYVQEIARFFLCYFQSD